MSCSAHTLFTMSDKRKYIKNPRQERKEKLGVNQPNRFQAGGRESLLNLY